MPSLVYARVIIRIVTSHHSQARARNHTSYQAYDRRLEQMRVKNINLFTAQKIGQAQQAKRILSAMAAITTEAFNALRLHVISEPGRNRIQRSEIHMVAAAVVPPCKLREKAARVTVLSKVQNALHDDSVCA